jgi:hypothetical protein
MYVNGIETMFVPSIFFAPLRDDLPAWISVD